MPNFDDTLAYMMPHHFGGQPLSGEPTIYDDTTALTIFYESDEERLASFLPGGFSLRQNEVMVSMMENRGVRWMGSEPYNIVAVNIAARWEAEGIDGWYCLVVWENRATPILPGREQTGIPKIFGEVEALRRFPDATVRTWSHYGGHTHCEILASDVCVATPEQRANVEAEFKSMNWFGFRFIPATNAAGAALAQPTLFPQEFKVRHVETGTPSLQWSAPAMHKNPTQAHIVASLRSLPIAGYTRPAVIMQARADLRGDLARVLA
ncbi:hypothetical protein D1224_14120 [Henriciella barbarensis]|uniref:Acetoacetate decarboxylase n=1 Tax=Henriciella barbarensis TaxID=86342 RepID=A0A399QTD0_9PROT|nr:acetoacetate decarboxylase family protein [Henriciella barbarensis]RIJ20809.1 hypothetical protein D1224_14120 [Henriciella barbarensis]